MLTGENQYDCETCNGKKDALKRLEIISLPEVLLIQLLRMTNFSTKISDLVDIPISIEFKNVNFRIQGFVTHIGGCLSSNRNHYTAHICHKDIGWCEYNDSKVTHKSEWQAVHAAK